MAQQKPQEIKQLIRLRDSDLSGEKTIYVALRSVKGVKYSLSNAICSVLNLDKHRKLGELSKEEIQKIEDVIRNPLKYNLPNWMINRRKDYETGEDKHLSSSDIKFVRENDIKRLRMIKSYRGVRHGLGLPVRGQRTANHFNKGNKTVGVQRKKPTPAKAETKGKTGK
ncbi:MAG: 30S ribosomal protein S13 [Candidatus Nanoarchaeia archaeon]|nr:30S ribosomal protein S13 [Candidatus Nanoarchaeia archaeon]